MMLRFAPWPVLMNPLTEPLLSRVRLPAPTLRLVPPEIVPAFVTASAPFPS